MMKVIDITNIDLNPYIRYRIKYGFYLNLIPDFLTINIGKINIFYPFVFPNSATLTETI